MYSLNSQVLKAFWNSGIGSNNIHKSNIAQSHFAMNTWTAVFSFSQLINYKEFKPMYWQCLTDVKAQIYHIH